LLAGDQLLAPGFGTEAGAWAAGLASPGEGWPAPEPPALAPAGSHSLAGGGEDLTLQLLGESDPEPSRPKFEKSVSEEFFQLLAALGEQVIVESCRQETIQEVKSMVQDFLSKNLDLAKDQDKVQMVLFCLRNYVSTNPDLARLSFRDKLEKAGQITRSFLNQSVKVQ